MLIRNLLVPYIFILLSILPVKAHDDYPSECCNGQDCRPVACEELNETDDGGYTWGKYKFSKTQVKTLDPHSKLRGCHVCIGKVLDEWSDGKGPSEIPYCVFPAKGV